MQLDIEEISALAAFVPRTLPCRIEGLDRLSIGVIRVRLRLPPKVAFQFVAGQYIDVIGKGGIKRSYSLASNPAMPDRLEIHVGRVPGGAMSQYWFERARPNDLLSFRGPLGTAVLSNIAGMKLVFLATGTGMAPIRAMLFALRSYPVAAAPIAVYLYWGCREQGEHYCDPLEVMPTMTYVPVLSGAAADWTGTRGYVQNALIRDFAHFDDVVVFACGSNAMIDSARETLLLAGLPNRRFLSESFVPSDSADRFNIGSIEDQLR